MCGIAGLLSFGGAPVDRRVLRTMRDRIAHRGPDGHGTMVDRNVGLVHTRLAILDLTDAARQPMWLPDRSACIVFNGEIYNFHHLRQLLANEGVRCRSSGDTEVLLRACRHWGVERTLPRLNGMFAFAYWDALCSRLWLARDRNGIKPLYYSRDGDRLLFASEIKAILAVRRGMTTPDMNSLLQLLDGGTTWEPYTAFRDVLALLPGCAMRVGQDDPSLRPRRYYDMFAQVSERRYRRLQQSSLREVAEEFGRRMRESVRIHSISDAPVATLASGGVDSCLIAALALEQDPDMSLYHAEVIGDQSEAPFARALAEHLQCSLVVAPMDESLYLRELARTTWFHEAPSAYHPNDVPFQLVARRAHQDGIKVLLTGEGSDELFIGYGHACQGILRSRVRYLLGRAGTLGEVLGRWLVPGTRETVVAAIAQRGAGNDWTARAQRAYAFVADPVERQALVNNALHLHAHLNSLLQRNDRMGMMHGMESRIPFLENEIVRFGLSLPLRHKHPSRLRDFLRGHPLRNNKKVVRAAARATLPRQLARRKKLGFPVSPERYLRVDATVLRGGFLESALGIRHREMQRVFAQVSPDARWNLFSTELFGRLFFCGDSIDRLDELLLERRRAA